MLSQTHLSPEARPAPQGVFFDLDQTLLQHSRPISSHMRTILLQLAPDRSPDCVLAFEQAISTSSGDLWGSVAEWSGKGEQALIQMFANCLQLSGYEPPLADRVLEILLQLTAESTTPSDGALATLEGLSAAGISIGIITNGFSVFQKHKARSHGLLDRVQAIVTSEDAGAHKPDRRIFDLALKTVGVEAHQAWYVGDSLDKDICGAIGAGLISILYDPYGDYDPARIAAEIRPTYVIRDLPQVLQLISPSLQFPAAQSAG